MKFKCQNCGWKFEKEIKNSDERKNVSCPECDSKIVRFMGAGKWSSQELIKQQEEKDVRQQEEKSKQIALILQQKYYDEEKRRIEIEQYYEEKEKELNRMIEGS